jgi:signal transduction histidine kinase
LPKLLLGVLGATAVPLGVVGAVSTGLAERALRARIEQDFATLAASTAGDLRRGLMDLGRALAVYPQLSDLERAAPEVAAGVLRVAYRAHEDLAAVAFVDGDGVEKAPGARLEDPAAAARLGRPAIDAEAYRAFLQRAPRREALERGFAVGAPDLATGRVAVAVRAPGAARLICADLTLDRIGRRLRALSAGGVEAVLVDGKRRRVAGGGGPPGEPVLLPGSGDDLPARAAVATVADPGGAALAGFAPVGELGLGVRVSQPERLAFAAVTDLRARLIFWMVVAAVAALVVGAGLARDLSRRVRQLVAGTAALARGRFARLEPDGGDELADLARDFNVMADALGRAQAEILAWGRELERRVEEKTAELRAAQELLLRARSLAAVGTLGAGVAHEINNPLTGLLGSAQLLLLDTPEGAPSHKLLREIEAQAQRIRAIVANLLRIVRARRAEELAPVDLDAVVDEVVEGAAARLAESGIAVERHRPAAKIPALRGDRALLVEALGELVTNARRAMPDGGKLIFTVAEPQLGLVSLRVEDTGRGIDPQAIGRIFDPFFTTKASWRATGFGLTLVHKIVAEHGGTIAVESPPGGGACFTLTFPADAGGHLP